MNFDSFCPKDVYKNCLYWKLSIPQKRCWFSSLRNMKDDHCLVLDGDTWFTKLFQPLKVYEKD